MELKIRLSSLAQYDLVSGVLQKTIEQFSELKGCTVYRGSNWRLTIGRHIEIMHEYDVNEGSFLHPKWVHKSEDRGWDNTNLIESQVMASNTLILESSNSDYDDAAIWIAGQCEKIFDAINIRVYNLEKIGQAIGWRCAYCNTSNDGKICSHCGAPRAW
jgi:hypothetical protein